VHDVPPDAQHADAAAPEPPRPEGWGKSIARALFGPLTRDNAWAWVKLILLILVVRWLFIDPFTVPSDSMLPTINGDPGFLKGDRVFVNKLAYNIRIPFTNIPILRTGEPRRWDIVVFRFDHPQAEGKIFIKRVVGLPGEHIEIRDGTVYADGVALDPPFPEAHYTRRLALSPDDEQALVDRQPPGMGQIVLEHYYREAGLPTLRYGVRDEPKYAVVPDAAYLMLGDNSRNSLDGRYYGWVPHDRLIGRAFAIFWPIGHWSDLSGFYGTWQGRLIFYGVPLALILFEFCILYIAWIWRVPETDPGGLLNRGDRVVVRRAPFGVRLPFTRFHITRGRAPRPGEVVMYQRNAVEDGEVCLGEIVAFPGDRLKARGGAVYQNGTLLGHMDGTSEVEWNEDGPEVALPGACYLARRVRPGSNGDPETVVETVAADRLVGSVGPVLWPLSRRGPVRLPEKG